jgi:uncharacterized protein (TIGR00730 family)
VFSPDSRTTEVMSVPAGERLRAILESPTYRLAEDDTAFMESDAARASRLSLEFMRADTYLRQHRIHSTVVVFGSARIKSPEEARGARELELSRYYDEARQLGKCLAGASHRPEGHHLVVVTGGGPGIMEAANRGAFEAGAPSMGFNIRMPAEQLPNPYITPHLAFRFHYFALRKMHFLLRARALVAFPGGFGTLDELFESLNLIQTHEIRPIPIVLVGVEHWRRVVDFDYLVSGGFIDEKDKHLMHIVDSGEAAAQIVLASHAARERAHPPGTQR